MTVAQKVGLMSEGGGLGNGTADGDIPAIGADRSSCRATAARASPASASTAAQLAAYFNNVQALAEGLPLGIPIANHRPIRRTRPACA